jgi:hypothetical protein
MSKVFRYNEFLDNDSDMYKYTKISDDELLEMTNLSPKRTGIDNIYIGDGKD